MVPAGEFVMGSAWGEDGHTEVESPQHRVRIAKPFAVGVSFQATHDAVVDGNGALRGVVSGNGALAVAGRARGAAADPGGTAEGPHSRKMTFNTMLVMRNGGAGKNGRATRSDGAAS